MTYTLKKHKDRGNVNESQVRIYGGKVRRLAYTLTENGMKAAAELMARRGWGSAGT